MQLLLVLALSGLVLFSSIAVKMMADIDAPEAAADALVQVDQYKVFMFVADQYMTHSAPTAPGVVSIDWATLSSTPQTPPATRNMPMPAGWRVVRGPDMSWVACTRMGEQAASALGQLLPAPSSPGGSATVSAMTNANTAVNLPYGSASQSFVVLGSPTAALSLANLCNV